jgi:Flp pilus assembly pilin Flp
MRPQHLRRHIPRPLEAERPMLHRLLSDRRAVTALEYGLIASVIVAAVIMGFHLLANSESTSFSTMGGKL